MERGAGKPAEPAPGQDAGSKTGEEGKNEGLSPGMAALLKQGNSTTTEPAAEAKIKEASEPPPDFVMLLAQALVRPALVAADVVLLVLAAVVVLRAHQPLGFWEVALCVIAVGLGACLSCLAIVMWNRKR